MSIERDKVDFAGPGMDRPDDSCSGDACDMRGPVDADSARPVATRRELLLLGASGVLAFAAEGLSFAGIDETAWPVILLAIGSIALGGLPTLRKGLRSIASFSLNINFLMTVAVTGAAILGAWPEAAMVVFLFAVAELVESYAVARSRNAVRSLMDLAPAVAIVKIVGDDEISRWNEVPVASVSTGAIVRVRPGERLPLDGVVVSGASAVDESAITGESMPVDKQVGDQVFAGTINGNGLLEFKTTGGTDETTIARIVRAVHDAQASRAPTQRFVDSFARIYTPVVVAAAVLVTIIPWLAFSQPIAPWFYKALVLLVIACPCALVIATPVTIVTGLAAAARRGILVKGGAYLEAGRHLRIIALDKTGTITEGRPRLTDTMSLTGPDDGGPQPEVLRIAASLDSLSDHPVARAVTQAWDVEASPLFPVEGFESITGRGVNGRIAGRTYSLGNHRLAEERGVCSPRVEAELERLESQGKTAIVLADDARAIGILAVADTPRESSVLAVRKLHDLGLRTVMLTGDNARTATAIASTVGIDDARGSLLPEEKLSAIEDLLGRYGVSGVGMVGDGINDAPALAKASVGFAMGAAGTDTAIETADVAFMRDDLTSLAEFIGLSRRTMAVLRQNFALALGLKALFFGLALFGLATLWMAVLADLGATLLVIANGLRLTRWHR